MSRRRYRRTDVTDEITAYLEGLDGGRLALERWPDFAPDAGVLVDPWDDEIEQNALTIGLWDACAERIDG